MEIKRAKYKIVVLGEANVGKTSIINSYLYCKFDKNQQSTIGINQYNNIELDDFNATISIWDTAGDERYRAIIPFYFRDSQGVVLVFDLTNEESFEKISYWIELYNEHSSTSIKANFILIGNKKDLVQDRCVSSEAAHEFALFNQIEYFETSALTGENIEESFYELVSEIVTHSNIEHEFTNMINNNEDEKIKSNSNCCK